MLGVLYGNDGADLVVEMTWDELDLYWVRVYLMSSRFGASVHTALS